MVVELGATAGEGKTVCVTGASGYIASWLVKVLLDRGYTVHGTVRSTADAKKTEHLVALEGAKERLHLFEANLLKEGSFDAAIAGCQGVFHVACPCFSTPTDPQAEMIDPAVKGTLNVLDTCSRTPGVARVVVTSSLATMMFAERAKGPDVVVDETWFSSLELLQKLKLWYCVAKTQAEEEAWKFSKEKGIDMVTIHAGNAIGTLLQPSLNLTSSFILSLLNGSSSTYRNATFGWVNVKDVVMAHVLAFENPSASGRYLVAETVAHFSEIANVLRHLYPHLPVPDKCENDLPFVPTWIASKERTTNSLGLSSYIPLEESIKETVESLKDKGFIV